MPKLVFEERLGFSMTWTADPARTDGDVLPGVGERAVPIILGKALRMSTDRRGSGQESNKQNSSHAEAFAARRLRVAGCTIHDTPMPSR